MKSAEKTPDKGNVTTHAMKAFLKSAQFTGTEPRTIPTATMLPTMHRLNETGIPNLEAITTVTAAPSSTQKPQKGLISVNFVPTVRITKCPISQKPTQVPKEP